MSRHPKDPRKAPPSVSELISRHSQGKVLDTRPPPPQRKLNRFSNSPRPMPLIRLDVIRQLQRQYAK